MTAVYFFAAILVVLLAAVLIAPLLDRAPDAGPPTTPAERLEEALEALRELEFEHETGKIEDADYRALRAEYAAAAIAARDAGAEAPDGSDAGCAVCGAALAPAAKFCSRCGTAVGERSGVPA